MSQYSTGRSGEPRKITIYRGDLLLTYYILRLGPDLRIVLKLRKSSGVLILARSASLNLPSSGPTHLMARESSRKVSIPYWLLGSRSAQRREAGPAINGAKWMDQPIVGSGIAASKPSAMETRFSIRGVFKFGRSQASTIYREQTFAESWLNENPPEGHGPRSNRELPEN